MGEMSTNIQYLPGVGPKRAALLTRELGVQTVGDLIRIYPFRYIDRSRVYPIAELRADMTAVQILGTVLRAEDAERHRYATAKHCRIPVYGPNPRPTTASSWACHGLRW